MSAIKPRAWVPAVAALLLAAAGLGSWQAPAAKAQTLTANVTVNGTAGIGTVPAHAISLNTAVYDGGMNDAAITPLLKAAGVNALRYPGGSYPDTYNWQTP